MDGRDGDIPGRHEGSERAACGYLGEDGNGRRKGPDVAAGSGSSTNSKELSSEGGEKVD